MTDTDTLLSDGRHKKGGGLCPTPTQKQGLCPIDNTKTLR